MSPRDKFDFLEDVDPGAVYRAMKTTRDFGRLDEFRTRSDIMGFSLGQREPQNVIAAIERAWVLHGQKANAEGIELPTDLLDAS